MVDSEAFRMNLSALRKVDATITSIVDIANQVALYKFISENNKWEKTEIEGTLFVYMRSQKPQHCFMIMNRLSTTNFVEPVTDNLDFKDQTPFLLYRNGKGHIYGIWFYELANCAKVFKLLTSLSQLTLTKNDSSNNLRQRSYSETNRKHQKQQEDIISLLTRAQDEYDKKSAKGTGKSSKKQSPNSDIVKPTPVRMNGAVTVQSETTPITLGMLFAQAGGVERKPDETTQDFDSRTRSFTASTTASELLSNSGKSTEAILQSLLFNSAHTVQHIEKLQKEENANGDKVPAALETRAVSAGERMLSAESVEKDLKKKLNILPKAESDSECKVIQKDLLSVKSNPIDIPIITPAMLESSFSSAPSAVIESSLDKFDINFCNKNNASSSSVIECSSFSPNQLLSPMDFTIPCRLKKNQPQTAPVLSSSYSPEPFFNKLLSHGNLNNNEDLLLPQSLFNGSNTKTQSVVNGMPSVTPLNRDQLREALIYMLQNDESFVMQLHDCYIKRLKSQLNHINRS